jgi:DNA-binding NarL/FixJ family response regulator
MISNVRTRVLIADDHMLIAEALRSFLVPHFDVVGIVDDGRRLLEMAMALRPDVVVADIGMPVLNGLDASERIKRALPHVRLIFVTVNSEPELIEEAFRRGASGYLLKTSAAAELVEAIRRALQGRPYVSPALAGSAKRFVEDPDNGGSSKNALTERQIEVLQLLAEGRSMKEAAALLNLTARTVAFHKYRIMESLRLQSDAEIVRYAVRNHIVFA